MIKLGCISKSPASPKQLDIKSLLKNAKPGKAKLKSDSASVSISEEVTEAFSPILGCGDYNLTDVASANDIETITSLLR